VRSLTQIDSEVRKGNFKLRSLDEETGISDEIPIKGETEADGYWNIRLLTYQVTEMHYRTPQFNLALLEHYINYQTAILATTYSAPTFDIRFETKQGSVRFDVKNSVDAVEFRRRFGLVPKS
jgi:hypothetical protein